MKLLNIRLDGTVHKLENLVLIIGPNGTGKTTLLSDLFAQAVTHTKNSTSGGLTKKWHEEMFRDEFYSISLTEYRQWHSEQEEIHGQTQNNQKMYASRFAFAQSQGYALSETEVSQLLDLIVNLPTSLPDADSFTQKIKGSYISHQSIDTRFRIPTEGSFSFHDRKPSSLFFHNPELLSAVNRYLNSYFGKKIFVEYTNDTNYQIVIGKASTPAPKVYSHNSKGIAKTLNEHKQWREQNPDVQALTEEGHGIRAFIEIIASLADPHQKILFMDEPELHLYPDIKRRLGRDIARISRNKQMFVVTHDTDIIDGIVNVENPFDVLRIQPSRRVDFFKFKSSEIRNIQAEKKSPDALKVGFYDCAVFVEGIAERYVYGGAISSKHLFDDYSSTIVACHGKDRIANHMKFALALDIPSVIIMDYDAIYNNKDALTDVLRTLVKYPKYISQEQLLKDLVSLVGEVKTLTAGVADKTKGKGGDLGRYSSSTLKKINELIKSLEKVGIFLVPIGELEDWVGAKKGTSPEIILSRYLSRSNSKYKPLTDFLASVCKELKSKLLQKNS